MYKLCFTDSTRALKSLRCTSFNKSVDNYPLQTYACMQCLVLFFLENSVCEKGWVKYHKNCYKYFQQYMSWPSARHVCVNNGGDLASIADDLEQDFTMFYFSNKQRTWVWLGNLPITIYITNLSG